MDKRSLGFETRKLAHAIKLYVDTEVTQQLDVDLSGVEGMTLGYIFHHPDERVTAQSLMEHFKVKKAACSQLLHSLSKKGIIKMETDPSDKRVKRIVLTKKGKDVHVDLHQRRRCPSGNALKSPPDGRSVDHDDRGLPRDDAFDRSPSHRSGLRLRRPHLLLHSLRGQTQQQILHPAAN